MVRPTGKQEKKRVETAGPTHKGLHFVLKKQTDMCFLEEKGNISLSKQSEYTHTHTKSYLR